MDDHFWPALYPGLIVGILYGLSLRRWMNVALASLGGLVGAGVSYEALPAIGITDDIVSVVSIVVLSFLGAFAAVYIFRRISGLSPPKP